MIDEVLKKYQRFEDALVLGISYKTLLKNTPGKAYVEVILRCCNIEKQFQWEIVKLRFIDVLDFRFIEDRDSGNIVIGEALILIEKEHILFDFQPIIYVRELRKDENSSFSISCISVEYEVINSNPTDEYMRGILSGKKGW